MYKYIIGVVASLLLALPAQASTLIVRGDKTHLVKYSEISALPTLSYETPLPWVDTTREYTGVTIPTLFAHLEMEIPETLHFRALNDYTISINRNEILEYKPIIAYLNNGERMKIRDKGPYWVIFSLVTHPELDTPEFHSKMIWQLKEIGTQDDGW
ncbi:hypothetical protein [Thaumasiovibrio subtropicus]|uniref:hypothetical protein n=1 Tax=Thaumasiovibrio subtropicus TaxID=1891207 RepID=UPI000B3629E2|nr:hypothetical protein [Thaumasiovibrio subtropicus]